MDCELFSKIVIELLTDHNKVVVPEFGTFCTEIVPACFSDKGYTINPPYKKVSFIQEAGNDSLLVDFYYSSNVEAGRPQAERTMLDFISKLKAQVLSTKFVSLPGFGSLRATRDNKVFFVAEENLAIFPSYDLLKPISLQSAASLMPESEQMPATPAVQKPSEPVVEIEQKKKTHKAVKWTFVWIIIVLVVAIATIAILGRVCPEILEKLLYTPEELEILHTQL